MIIKANAKLFLNISRVLTIVVLAIYITSFRIQPTYIWYVSLGILVIALFMPHRRIFELAIKMLWLVRIEPATTDLLLALGLAKASLSTGRLPRVRVGSPLWMLSVYAVLAVIQISWSHNIARACYYTVITIYTMNIIPIIFAHIGSYYRGESWKKALILAIDLTTIAVLVAGIASIIGIADYFPWLYHTQNRGRAFFKDVNVAGPFIVFGALQMLARMIISKRYSLPTVLRLLAYSIAVVFTFSRGAFLNYVIGIISIGAIATIRKRGWRITILLIIIGCVSVYYIPRIINTFGQKRVTTINTYDTEGRFAAWNSGLMMFLQSPWGIGPGQFEVMSPRYQTKYIGNIDITPSSHSLYIRLLAENGILGLALYIIAIAAVILGLIRVIRTTHTNSCCFINATWLLAALLGILAEGTVIDILHWRHYGIAIGLALFYIRKCNKPKNKSRVMVK